MADLAYDPDAGDLSVWPFVTDDTSSGCAAPYRYSNTDTAIWEYVNSHFRADKALFPEEVYDWRNDCDWTYEDEYVD